MLSDQKLVNVNKKIYTNIKMTYVKEALVNLETMYTNFCSFIF